MPTLQPMVADSSGQPQPPTGFSLAPGMFVPANAPGGYLSIALPGCVCARCATARDGSLPRCNPPNPEWRPSSRGERAEFERLRALSPAVARFHARQDDFTMDDVLLMGPSMDLHEEQRTSTEAVDSAGRLIPSPIGVPIAYLRAVGLYALARAGYGSTDIAPSHRTALLDNAGIGVPNPAHAAASTTTIFQVGSVAMATPRAPQRAPWAYALLAPSFAPANLHQAGMVLIAYGGCTCFNCDLVRAMAISQGLLTQVGGADSVKLQHRVEYATHFARLRAYCGHWDTSDAICDAQDHADRVEGHIAYNLEERDYLLSHLVELNHLERESEEGEDPFPDSTAEFDSLLRCTVPQPRRIPYISVSMPQAPRPMSEPRNSAPELKLRKCGLVTPRFGVELECLVPVRLCGGGELAAQQYLAHVLEQAGMASQPERYNHEHRPYWKITTDASLSGSGMAGAEVVTPALEDFEPLRQGMRALSRSGARINRTCGCHVHFDAGDFTLETWKRLLVLYATMEPNIDKFMPPSRRANANNFCMSLRSSHSRGLSGFKEKVNSYDNLRDLAGGLLQGNRYWKVNPQSWWQHGTVEFRQFGGTLNYGKVRRWILLLDALVGIARDTAITLPDAEDDMQVALERVVKLRGQTIERLGLAKPDEPARLSDQRKRAWKKLCEGASRVPSREDVQGVIQDVRGAFSDLTDRSWRELGDTFLRAVEPQLVNNLSEASSFFCERAEEFAEAEEWVRNQ